MFESLEHLLDQGFAVVLLILGLSGFFIIHGQFLNFMDNSQVNLKEKGYIEGRVVETRETTVNGGQVIRTIMDGDEAIRYVVYDNGSPGNLIVDVTGKGRLGHMSAVTLNGTYDTSYGFTHGQISEVIYKEE